MTERAWRIWIAEPAAAAMKSAAAAAHPDETGGVLIGVHTHGVRPWVAHAIELPSPKASGNFYEVPAGARRKAVERLRGQDPRLGYLGEWHVHPADAPPSPTDTVSIEHLAEDRTGGCDRPVLLVVRKVKEDYKVDARQLSHGTLRRLQIIATGVLPEPGNAPVKAKPGLRNRRRLYRGTR